MSARSNMRKYLVASVVATALFLGACQILLGIEDRPTVEVPAEAAAPPDSSRAVEPDAFDPCTTDNLPAAPAEELEGSFPDTDLLYVMTSIDFGLDAGLPFGVNLDKTCTCPGTSSCKRPLGTAAACDEPNGVDNAAKGVFAALRTLDVERTVNETLRSGGSGALLRIQGYNGQANDRSVTVAMYGSIGVVGAVTGTGKDRWRVDTATVSDADIDAPKNFATNAWVTDSVLVASIGADLTLGGGNGQPPLATKLSAGYVVARIGENGTLTGVIAGRWELKEALTAVRALRLQGSTEPMCADSGTFQFIRTSMCGAADIVSDLKADGKNNDCDALSVHVGFTGRLATFGPVEARPDSGIVGCATTPTCSP